MQFYKCQIIHKNKSIRDKSRPCANSMSYLATYHLKFAEKFHRINHFSRLVPYLKRRNKD